MLTAEVSNIYVQAEKQRRVHNIIFAPSFEVVDQLNDELSKWGRLDYDGRPMFGKTCAELVDLVLGVSKDCEIIPAHAWTPWYSIFGNKSGFNSVEECFGDKTKHIHALETGLSSDPAMNWRLSALDCYTLVSFSDSHSPYPWRIGREATVFDLEKPSYFEIIDVIRKKDRKKLLYTIEVQPAYGKYHYDGHRNCGVSFSPAESKKHKNICPVCKKLLTIGVLHRVEELADRPSDYVPSKAIPFKTLIPLSELIAALYKTTPATKQVWREFNMLVREFGNELTVLLETTEEKLQSVTHAKLAKAIINNRKGNIKIKPGYDGEYGELILEPITETEEKQAGQKVLTEF